jgi:helix-turn-helix protein
MVEPSNMEAGQPAGRLPTEPPEGPSSLTISQAARACGVNRRTIRRHREAGDFPGTYRDGQGTWRILVSDLAAAGYPPHLIRRLDEPTEATQLDRLRGEVAVLRERLVATERVARERQERIEDLRLVMRMLPGPGLAPEVAEALQDGGVVVRRATASPRAGVLGGGGGGVAEATATLTRADQSDALIWLPDQQARASVREPLPAIPEAPVARAVIPPIPDERRGSRRGWWPWRRLRA